MKERYFHPGGLVPGKQLEAVMLRAQAFDYIWKVVNLPIMKDGNTLAFKLDIIVPGRMELPKVEFRDKRARSILFFRYPIPTDGIRFANSFFS